MAQTLLSIYTQPPDGVTEVLAEGWVQGREVTKVFLYQEPVDYERLVDMIFASDQTVIWF